MPVCSVFAKHCLYKTSHASHLSSVVYLLGLDRFSHAQLSRVFVYLSVMHSLYKPTMPPPSLLCLSAGIDLTGLATPSRHVFFVQLFVCLSHAPTLMFLVAVTRWFCVNACVRACVCARACVCVCLSHAPATNVSRAYPLHVLLFWVCICVCLFKPRPPCYCFSC